MKPDLSGTWLDPDLSDEELDAVELQTIVEALAHPVRRYMIDLLEVDDALAGDLAASASAQWGISMSRASQHLQVLARAGLVDVSQDANHREYRRRSGAAQPLADWLTRSELSASKPGPSKPGALRRSA